MRGGGERPGGQPDVLFRQHFAKRESALESRLAETRAEAMAHYEILAREKMQSQERLESLAQAEAEIVTLKRSMHERFAVGVRCAVLERELQGLRETLAEEKEKTTHWGLVLASAGALGAPASPDGSLEGADLMLPMDDYGFEIDRAINEATATLQGGHEAQMRALRATSEESEREASRVRALLSAAEASLVAANAEIESGKGAFRGTLERLEREAAAKA